MPAGGDGLGDGVGEGVGDGLGEGEGDGDGVGDGEGLGDGEGVGVGDGDGLGEGETVGDGDGDDAGEPAELTALGVPKAALEVCQRKPFESRSMVFLVALSPAGQLGLATTSSISPQLLLKRRRPSMVLAKEPV